MAVWSEIDLSSVKETFRLDAEFYRPEYLRYAASSAKGDLISNIAIIFHPTEIVRVYEEEGIQILLAQNVRPNRLDFSASVFMPPSVEPTLRRNLLKPGDVLMTRSGANFGETAMYRGEPAPIYACADVLIIRPHGIPGGYISTYFNTMIGRELLTRGAYGAAQPHIAPNYLHNMRLPRVGDENERKIDRIVTYAYDMQRMAASAYTEAETLLLDSLGLNTLDTTQELAYERNFREVVAAGRYDAQYFHPKYQRAMALMARSGQTLGDVAHQARRVFKPIAGETFQYIEIGNVGGNGQAESEPVQGENAPSRAQWIVKAGDVITSTVRPIRRLTALITPEQEDFVCSSGFVVLSPERVEPEMLTLYLRLPIVAEILDLHTTASMYPAIASDVLQRLPITLPEADARQQIIGKVQEARIYRIEAQRLLDHAKARVEEMILSGGRA